MAPGFSMRVFEDAQKIGASESVALRPLLIIDTHGRIERGVGGGVEQGRHCWEVFGCSAASRRGCNALRTAQRGPVAPHPEPASSVDHHTAQPCLVAALPQPVGGLAVWGPFGRGAPNAGDLLRFISDVASALLPRDLTQGSEVWLELLRTAVAADDGELFLVDLYGREMLLTTCVGADREALWKRSRFERGDGLPGLAFAQGRPVTTLNLEPQDRFAKGEFHPPIQAFLSVPINGPDGQVIGCANLAWRHHCVPVQRLADALWAALPGVGNAIYAAYWLLRQKVARSGFTDPGPESAGLLKALHAAGADAGSLVMWDERDRKVLRNDRAGAAPPACPWLASPEASPCSSRDNESAYRLLTLGKPGDRVLGPCAQVQFDGSAVCCVPVLGQPSRMGRLLIGFRDRGTHQSSRLLVPLQIMAEQVAMQLPEPTVAPAICEQQPAIAPLTIRCFGHFEVSIGEHKLGPSSFPRRDALTLLKMLVLRAGKQLHRDRLIDWLWPGASERSGLNRLHGVVHALRGVIEPHAAERRWTYLLNEGETYTFLPGETTSVDLISFQENLTLARRDLRENAFAPDATHYLERAVELYRGDLYEGDQYCEWCDVERFALQREFLDALASLARIYLTLGEAKRATEALRRALAYDPSREDLHNELIRCLVRQRRYKEAKDQVSECIRHLREEVGVEPTSETLRLHHSLFTSDKTDLKRS